LQTYAPDVHSADSKHLGALAHFSYLPCGRLGLGDIAPDDTGIGPEVYEGASLGAADVACAASDEHDTVI